jgi:anti-anti-sigma regulatory factor
VCRQWFGNGIAISEGIKGDKAMMKITSESDDTTITINLEGALTNQWVKELLLYWQDEVVTEKKRRRIDLTGITFIDDAGKALLALLYRDGAQLVANGLMTTAIVEEITKTN